jgi:hypothetical protein
MAKLNWKQSRDDWHIRMARASDGGRYRIRNYSGTGGGHGGFVVNYCPPKRRWWPEVGTAATESEAVALAQAHNDKKLAATANDREHEISRLTQEIAAIEAGRFDDKFPSASMKALYLMDRQARMTDLQASGPLPARSNNKFKDALLNSRTYEQQPDGTYKALKGDAIV